MKNRKMFYLSLLIISVSIIFLFESCTPIREFMRWNEYEGNNDFDYTYPNHDHNKKTIVVIADNEGTEIFDMLAPFYLFSTTEKANVYIVAEKKRPIIIRKGLFILPHFTFNTLDSLNIKPDVIVIPNLSAMNAKEINPTIVEWISTKYNLSIKLLAVCDGALTAAATGLYDGIPLTTHASDFSHLKKQFPKPHWVNHVSVTTCQNQILYSTAGVSNATEGSLVVIHDLFGQETMEKVMADINYPYTSPRREHTSVEIDLKNKLRILKKVTFQKNRKIGVLLENGINEFELAAVLDTYNRTFPRKINSFSTDNLPIVSKNGVTIIPTGNIKADKIDEMHILVPLNADALGKNIKTVRYESKNHQYIFDYALQRVKQQNGDKFMAVVKVLLDYN